MDPAKLFDHLRELAIACGALAPRQNANEQSEAAASRPPMAYYFNGRKVCREAWVSLHCIGKGRFQRIFEAVMKGQLSAPTDTRYLKRGSQKNVSAKWGEVHGYLLELYECQAETFPDDADSDGCDDELSYDENSATPVIHVTRPDGTAEVGKPSGGVVHPTPKREERYLPPTSMFDQWKQMIVTRPDLNCSFKLFWQVWCSDFHQIKIRKGFKHHCCTVCLKHKALIRQLAHDVKSREKQRFLWQRHINSQYDDRRHYWHLRGQSRLHKREVVIIIDAADQAKFCWPRSSAFRAHQFDQVVRPRLHINACIVHGYNDILAVSHCDVHTGGSSTVELVSFALTALVKQGVSLQDRELYLQMDNAPSSNKNVTVMVYLAVVAAWFGLSRTQALFLRSGHSHEDVDQQHGQMPSFTKNKLDKAETLDDFVVNLTDFINNVQRPHEASRLVVVLDEMRNWKSYLSKVGLLLKGHGGQRAPHVLDFCLEKGDVILRWVLRFATRITVLVVSLFV